MFPSVIMTLLKLLIFPSSLHVPGRPRPTSAPSAQNHYTGSSLQDSDDLELANYLDVADKREGNYPELVKALDYQILPQPNRFKKSDNKVWSRYKGKFVKGMNLN